MKFMKRILSILLCMTCLSFAFAQNYDETVGVRYFNDKQYSQALPFLQRAAKAGSLKALDCLGQMYGNGWGVEKNETIMRNMYNRAIQANYAPSMYNMAFAVGDEQEMLRLLKKAASLDYVLAYRALGDFYKTGLWGDNKLEEAKEAYLNALRLGLELVYNNLGSVYKQLGDGKKSYEMFMEAMKRDNLWDRSLSDLVDLLCDKTAVSFSNDYDKNLVEAGRILEQYRNIYPEKVKELEEKYGEEISHGKGRIKTARENEEFLNSSYMPKLGEGIANAEDVLSIPAFQKKAVMYPQYFGDKFIISFSMRATDVEPKNGFLFYGGDVDHPRFPQACIKNSQFSFKLGVETYLALPFKQFKNVQSSLLDGNWHHIILTYDRVQKKKVIYVDGQFKGNEFVSDNDKVYYMRLVFCAGSGGLQIKKLRFFRNNTLDPIFERVIYKNDK